MNDYTKYDFYSDKNKETGVTKYYIRVNKEMIEVSKEVYYVCYNSYRKQLRDNLKDKHFNLVSLDMPFQDGRTLLNYTRNNDQNMPCVEEAQLLEYVMNVINELNAEDKELITELLINDRKERDLAQQYAISQQSINKRKKRIIKKIKEKLENGC